MEDAKNKLAYVWRNILYDLNIDFITWSTLLNSYLTDPENGIPQDYESRSYESGRLSKGLVRDRLSLKTFNKGLKLIRSERIALEIILRHSNNVEATTHTIDIIYRDVLASLPSMFAERKIPSTVTVKKARLMSSKRYSPKLATGNVYKLSEAVYTMLASENKQIALATGMLSKMWRKILEDRSINGKQWSSYMTNYIARATPEVIVLNSDPVKVKEAKKKLQNKSGNLNKDLVRTNMTYGVFNKAMMFLDIKSYDLTIKIKRIGLSKVTVHELKDLVPRYELENS